MKVLMVSNYATGKKDVAYAGIFVERQLQSLRDAGITVEAFDIGRPGSAAGFYRSWRALRRFAREFAPDLVHAQYGAAVGLLAALAGPPAVITFSGTDLHRGGGQTGLLRRTLGRIVSNAAALLARRVICVSEDLRALLWFKRDTAVIIPRGVDLRLFYPGPRDEARAHLGWTTSAPCVLFAGGRDPVNKGLELATRAVELARQDIPELELHVLRTVAPEQMPDHYRAADVLLFTSHREGSPNTVKEALACNLPVVSVAVGDVAERLSGVEPSAIVERDAAALANAIISILRRGQRSNGREHVSAISLEAVAKRVLDVYQDCLNATR